MKDITNADRAEFAQAALDAFMRETRCDEDTVLLDLLCDLRHWADRNDEDFEDINETARLLYVEECDNELGF